MEDYQANRKGPQQGVSGFGAPAFGTGASATPLFGQTDANKSAFGQTSAFGQGTAFGKLCLYLQYSCIHTYFRQ